MLTEESCTFEDGSNRTDLSSHSTLEDGSNHTDLSSRPTLEDGSNHTDLSSRSALKDGSNRTGRSCRSTVEDHVVIDSLSCGKSIAKKNFCLYCSQPKSKIARHLLGSHADETLIQKILSLPKLSKERRKLQEKVRREGNFLHNQKVLKSKHGKFVPQMRKASSSSANVSEYAVCSYCKAYVKQTFLWKHQKRCLFNNDTFSQSRRCVNSKLSLQDIATSDIFKKKIIIDMKCDSITAKAISDPLILKLGEDLHNKSKKFKAANYIRQRMRLTARLLIAAQSINEKITTLEELILPINYETVISSVKKLAQFDEKSEKFKISALPLKIGQNLKRCAEVFYRESLRLSDETRGKNACEFIRLMESDYNAFSSCSLSTLSDQQLNEKLNTSYFILAKDVKKLNEFLNDEMEKNAIALQGRDTNSFTNLAEQVLSSILLFNRKRVDVIQRVTLEDYHQRTSLSDFPHDLSPIELALRKVLQCIKIYEKKCSVKIILWPLHIKVIDILLASRESVGINTENNFLFPHISTDEQYPIDSTKALRSLSKAAHLDAPDQIRSTLLGKHVATISQLVNLSLSEMHQLTNYMGHNLNLHIVSHRVPDDSEKITKVGRLLAAFEDGKFKRGDIINLKDIDGHQCEMEDIVVSEKVYSNDIPPSASIGEINNVHSEDALSDEDWPPPKKNKFKRNYHKWSLDEKHTIISNFSESMRLNQLPGKKECQQFLQMNPSIKRTWTNIKDCVRNESIKTELHNTKGLGPS